MSTKAVLKGGICSIDLPQGPPQLPADPSNCWILVYSDIGPADQEISRTFLFYVCTPRRLAEILRERGFEFGNHLLVVPRFDWTLVERAIASVCEETSGETWEEVAAKLSRYGELEMEDDLETQPDSGASLQQRGGQVG